MLTLRPYQKEDVQRLLTKDAMAIFNEQRTGKTPTALYTMKKRKVKHLLVVCTASMLYKWKAEACDWLGISEDTVEILASAKKIKANGADTNKPVWIINYENLRGTRDDTKVIDYILKKYKPDGLIVDEAHYCKDYNTLNFRAINSFNYVKYRLYLTGTPAPNKPYEVWSILHFCDPHVFNGFWKFAYQFFRIETIRLTGRAPIQIVGTCANRDMLQALLSEYSIMRKRKDIMKWLPLEERPTQIKLEMTKEQQKYITSLEELFEIDDKVICKGTLDRLVRTRQILAAPEILDLKSKSPKLEWLVQYIKDYPEKQLLVFSCSTKFLKIVGQRLELCKVAAGLIIGETPKEKRSNVVNDFQEGKLHILLIQTQAGKEGLTLDNADATIFLDVFPPAADYQQAKDRMVATVPDKVKPKEIIHLIMKDSYDERLYALVKHNIAADEVVNDYINYIRRKKNEQDNNKG